MSADASMAMTTAPAGVTSQLQSSSDHHHQQQLQSRHFAIAFHGNNNNDSDDSRSSQAARDIRTSIVSMTTSVPIEDEENLTESMSEGIVRTGCVSDLPPTPAATPSNVSDIVEEEILSLDQLRVLMTKGVVLNLSPGATILTPCDPLQENRPQSTSSCPSEEMDLMPLTSGSLSDSLSGHRLSGAGSSPDHESVVSSNESAVGVMVSMDHGPEDQVQSLTLVSGHQSPDESQSFASSASSLVFRDHGFVCRIKQESQERDDDDEAGEKDEGTEARLMHGSGTQVECKAELLPDDKSATRAMILRQRLQQQESGGGGGDDPEPEERREPESAVIADGAEDGAASLPKKRRLSSTCSPVSETVSTATAAAAVPDHVDAILMPADVLQEGAQSKETSRSGDDPDLPVGLLRSPAASSCTSASSGSPPKVTGILVQQQESQPQQQHHQEASSSPACASAASAVAGVTVAAAPLPLAVAVSVPGTTTAGAAAAPPALPAKLPKSSSSTKGMGCGRPGYITCSICSATKYYSHVQRRFGQFSCEPCSKFMKRFLRDPKKYTCYESGNCLIGRPSGEQEPRGVSVSRCKACWLKICLEKFVLEPNTREAIQQHYQPQFVPSAAAAAPAGSNNGSNKHHGSNTTTGSTSSAPGLQIMISSSLHAPSSTTPTTSPCISSTNDHHRNHRPSDPADTSSSSSSQASCSPAAPLSLPLPHRKRKQQSTPLSTPTAPVPKSSATSSTNRVTGSVVRRRTVLRKHAQSPSSSSSPASPVIPITSSTPVRPIPGAVLKSSSGRRKSPVPPHHHHNHHHGHAVHGGGKTCASSGAAGGLNARRNHRHQSQSSTSTSLSSAASSSSSQSRQHSSRVIRSLDFNHLDSDRDEDMDFLHEGDHRYSRCQKTFNQEFYEAVDDDDEEEEEEEEDEDEEEEDDEGYDDFFDPFAVRSLLPDTMFFDEILNTNSPFL